MRYRQVHLDFHTSSVINDVGSAFDASDFVKTLKDAHVNSINIFAKCHHGMCYYPTKVGTMHPSLKFDLMGTMIDVLHQNDIKCPIYFPLGWEEDAALHVDWLEIGKDNIPGHKLPTDATNNTWKKLCLNNPDYLDYVEKQLSEIIETYDVDGLWFDIIFQQKCLCPHCVKEMRELGLSPENDDDVIFHDEYVLKKLQARLNSYIGRFNKNITTFYNSSWDPNSGISYKNGDINAPICTSIDDRSSMQDHLEIESLPSGHWGYTHFPLFVNYHNRFNAPIIGMNAKFHLTWGDHGSLKNNEALEFECFRMIANGCASSVGDQLHPRGYMNKSAYQRIGRVYSKIEKLEPYIDNSIKIADCAVIVSTDFFKKDASSDKGALRMLSELHYTFDFIPVTDDLSRYKLVILPDHIRIDKSLSDKLREYIKNGGKVIATCQSTDYESLGIKYIKDSDYEPAYIVIPDKLIDNVEPLEYVCYKRGVYVESTLPVKAYVGNPYFNRTADCFSSHMHFPFDKESKYPAILLNQDVGYCAFPLFYEYQQTGNRIYRDIIKYLIESLLREPSVKVSLPSCSEITLRKTSSSVLLHILNYIPERRTETIDIVDTKIPLYNVTVKVLLPFDCSSVRAILSDAEIPFKKTPDGYTEITVPVIDGYDCIVFN